MTIDRKFRRIADGLRTADMVQRSLDAQNDLGIGDLFSEDGSTEGRFLDFYSVRGMRRVVEAYGIHGALEEMGYPSYEIHFTSPDPYDHRMQVVIDGRTDDDHRLIDLRISFKQKEPKELLDRLEDETRFSVLLVNWLAMQSPRAKRPPKRPLVPGQRYPGLRIAYAMHNILLLMARRLGRDGVTNVPERFHLALLYLRYGYLAVNEAWRKEVLGVAADLAHLDPVAVAWAAERGCIKLRDGQTWSYTPGTVLAPVSKRLQRAVDGPWHRLRRRFSSVPSAGVSLDMEALRESLEREPVEGLAV